MSLISTYQSRKSLFAEKLITKGVEASATDGLTTLINKIDDIQSFTEGLLLYADKKIAQSEDTVNLYALLLEDNVAVSGEKVKIYSDIYLRSETCSSTDSLYDDYYVSSSKSGGVQYDFIGSNNDTYIRYNSTTINIFYGDHWSSDFGYTGEFHIKDGVLTYKDSQGVSHTVDVSMVDTTKVPSNPITVHYKWVEVTTGSDGVASYEYACTGSGLREFYATYSSIVSETYSVLDCIWYDPLTETPLKNNWYSTNLNLNTDSDGTLLTNNSSNNLYFKPYPSNADLMLDTPFIVEFTVKSISGSVQPQIVGSGVSAGWIQDEGNGTHRLEIQADSQVHKFKSENSDTYITLTDFTQVTFTGQSYCRLLIASNSSVKLKDFKIYPI